MGMVAACGLIYEYLMAHYAGRILGTVEPTLYAMIGLMIVAMGLGAFAAKWIGSIYRGFAWLELGIAVLGGTSVLALSAAVALAYSLPDWLATVYGLADVVELDGGVAASLVSAARVLPFVTRLRDRFPDRYGDSAHRARTRNTSRPGASNTTSARCTARTTSAPASERRSGYWFA